MLDFWVQSLIGLFKLEILSTIYCMHCCNQINTIIDLIFLNVFSICRRDQFGGQAKDNNKIWSQQPHQILMPQLENSNSLWAKTGKFHQNFTVLHLISVPRRISPLFLKGFLFVDLERVVARLKYKMYGFKIKCDWLDPFNTHGHTHAPSHVHSNCTYTRACTYM